MSRTITVKDGDTLENIAAREYGDPSRWREIIRSTQSELRWDKTNRVFPGETVIIPEYRKTPSITGKQPDDLTIIIGGRTVPVESARIIRTMDTGTDAWTARIAWTPGNDPDLDRVTRPYGYPDASAYIGNELLVNGLLYVVEPGLEDTGQTKTLTGYSFTADAIDSTVKPPYEWNNITLEQLATELVKHLEMRPVFETDTGGAFARETMGKTDKIFDFLSKLAAQRGILLSSTPGGDPLFVKADTTSAPVGTLTEDQFLVTGWKAKYDGRKRFNSYRCVTSDATMSLIWGESQEPSKVQVAVDDQVPRSRFETFKTDSTTSGNIKNAAEWRRSRQIIDALTISLPVSGWYAPNGKLWRENTQVTVVSETLGVPSGFTFLIRAVEYTLESNERRSTLSLVPPQSYSGEPLGDIWK